jgi:predicted ArsR family transcriptional regulator
MEQAVEVSMPPRTPSSDPDVAAVALLDEPTRRRLYDWVVDQDRPVGREEAARALAISRALATFHLDRLVDGGLLAADYRRINERRGPGAGRPARVYWRADRDVAVSVPKRRYQVAADLLAKALERRADSNIATRETGHAFGHQLGERARRRAPRRSPLSVLRAALADGGYRPTEPGPDGVIRLRNCPFHALVAEHRPLVCGMNLAVAEGLVEGTGAAVGARPVLDPQPGYCCVAFTPQTSA